MRMEADRPRLSMNNTWAVQQPSQCRSLTRRRLCTNKMLRLLPWVFLLVMGPLEAARLRMNTQRLGARIQEVCHLKVIFRNRTLIPQASW